MARLAKIVANEKKKKLAKKYKNLRTELREKISNPGTTDEDRVAAMIKMQKLPRNSAGVRVRNRCEMTGRSRGYYRAFKLSRISFRKLALEGMIPGVTKSSW